MNLYELAYSSKRLRFRLDGKMYQFDPDGRLTNEENNPVQVTKQLLARSDFEIVCDHPVNMLKVFATRADIGIDLECGKCDQKVRIAQVETAPPRLPEFEAEAIRKSVHDSVDRQWKNTPIGFGI